MSRARQVANFDPALFAADEVSGDKVHGGTISGSPTLVTPALGTPVSGTLTNATFPAGHIIQQKELVRRHDTTAINTTDGSSYADTGLGGNFTTVKASTGSFLKFEYYCGMIYHQGGNYGQFTITLRGSSDTTTFADDDDMLHDADYKNFSGGDAAVEYYGPITAFLYSGNESSTSGNVPNLSSWSAGETLYWRLYMKGHTGTAFKLYHELTTLTIFLNEIAV